MELLLAEDFEGTHQFEKIKEVGASYEVYMKQQKSTLMTFSQNFEDQSNAIKNNSSQTSEILLFVGTLPYLLILITLITSLLVILWLSRSTNGFKVHD
jgi:flagellar biosynthesis protein FliP